MTVGFSNLSQEQMAVSNVNNKKQKVSGTGGAALAIVGSGVVAQAIPNTVGVPVMKKMQKIGNLEPEAMKTMHDAVKQMVVDNGLDKKGVRIKFLSALSKKKKSKFPGETPLKNYVDILTTGAVRDNQNAFFVNKDLKLPTMKWGEFNEIRKNEGLVTALKKLSANKAVYIKKNSIILPKEGLGPAGFHEVGHAMNANLSKVGKFLQKFRALHKLAPLIGIYAACTRKSVAKDGQELTAGQKTKNFIRDNAAVLAFASALPMVAEEMMATVKGQKYANKVLSKDMAKKVLRGNICGGLTYITLAVASGLAAWSATKIKDNVIAKKEAKRDQIELARQQAIDAYNAQFAPSDLEPHTSIG